MNAIVIPKRTFLCIFSFKNITESMNIRSGPVEAITGALILVVFSSPRKKKDIFTVMPKKDATSISIQSFRVSCFMCTSFTKGRNKSAAKKKRMNARVKGGIFVSEYLNIGAAAPQIILAMISEIMGFTFFYGDILLTRL